MRLTGTLALGRIGGHHTQCPESFSAGGFVKALRTICSAYLTACVAASCVDPQRVSIIVHDDANTGADLAEVYLLNTCAAVEEIGGAVDGARETREVAIESEQSLAELDPGTYAAYARAWEPPCARVSAACEEFDVPREGGVVEVWLQATAIVGCGEGMHCVQEGCRPE